MATYQHVDEKQKNAAVRTPASSLETQPAFESDLSGQSGEPGQRLLQLQSHHGNRYTRRLSARLQARLPVTPPSRDGITRLPTPFANPHGRPLPEAVQQHMSGVFKADFTDVRVHVGPEAESIGALAFTQGSDIYFAPDQYKLATAQGRRLLAHELTHVVQQRHGRVRHPFGAGTAIVQDNALEAEADRMGQAAAHLAAPTRHNSVILPKSRQSASGVVMMSHKKEQLWVHLDYSYDLHGQKIIKALKQEVGRQRRAAHPDEQQEIQGQADAEADARASLPAGATNFTVISCYNFTRKG